MFMIYLSHRWEAKGMGGFLVIVANMLTAFSHLRWDVIMETDLVTVVRVLMAFSPAGGKS